MNNNYKKFADFLLIFGFVLLLLILASAIVTGHFNGKGLNLDKGQKLSGLIIGSVGICFTLGGVLLYYSALRTSIKISDSNTFLVHFSNTINNLGNLFSKISNPFEYEDLIGANAIIGKTNLNIKNHILDYLKTTYLTDELGKKSDMQFIHYLNDYYKLTYSSTYFQFLLNIEYLLFIINQRSIDEPKNQYYNMLKANIPPNAYTPLFYYLIYKIEVTLDKKEKEAWLEIIKDSNLFEYMYDGDLILVSHRNLIEE